MARRQDMGHPRRSPRTPASEPSMPKLFRVASRLLAVVVILGVVALLAAWLFWRGSLAELDGELALPGLSAPATVERDALGVATVTAANEADAARALGF